MSDVIEKRMFLGLGEREITPELRQAADNCIERLSGRAFKEK